MNTGILFVLAELRATLARDGQQRLTLREFLRLCGLNGVNKHGSE
jgi:hypothetical protein